jgi:RNA polymerase sigma-70 factor (ECF subfamily)
VWKLAFHLLQDHYEAEEVVQDTFVKALRALRSFRGDCPFRTYLLTICRNRSRDALEQRRRRQMREVLSGDDPIDLDESRERIASIAAVPDPQPQWAARLDLAAALATLPDAEREAFVLITVMQKTAEEAAAILSSPRTTVQTWLGRARAKLAIRLEGYP